jgi:hypothetical protein
MKAKTKENPIFTVLGVPFGKKTGTTAKKEISRKKTSIIAVK